MHAEDELASRDVLQLVDELAVAVLRGDALALEEAERMRACGADPEPLGPRHAAHVAAELDELAQHVGGGVAHGGRDLEHRLHQLGIDLRLELVALDRREHRVDVLDEVERGAVEQLVLLFDAERVRIALSELVVEHACP
jgi:hypothetical protein